MKHPPPIMKPVPRETLWRITMTFTEFYDHAQRVFDKNPSLPQLTKEKAEKLFELTTHMLEVNKNLNLTAIKDEKAVISKHYADSLMVNQYIDTNSTVIDIGCGAGFPTLPLAIFREDLTITAVDSTAKRINYVQSTARMLGLDNVTAIAARAEDMANSSQYREKFDYATARAVASLPILTELCLPFVRIDGKFIAMKSQKAADEISASQNAITKCGGVLKNAIEVPLVDVDGTFENRTLVHIAKTSKTPKEFPRHYSKISKKPL